MSATMSGQHVQMSVSGAGRKARIARFLAVFGPGLVVMLADTDVGRHQGSVMRIATASDEQSLNCLSQFKVEGGTNGLVKRANNGADELRQTVNLGKHGIRQVKVSRVKSLCTR